MKCHYFRNLGSLKSGIDAISKKLSTGYVGKFIVLSLFCLALGNARRCRGPSGIPVSARSFSSSKHLEFTTDTFNNITDCRSAIGVMTFDGAGHYTLNAQQTVTTLAATPLMGTGTYGVGSERNHEHRKSAAQLHFSSTLRVGTEAIVGSTTESGDNTFDLFIAVPAATATQAASVFGGTYLTSSFSLPLGVGTYASNAFFKEAFESCCRRSVCDDQRIRTCPQRQ